jgi:hypothetical protein
MDIRAVGALAGLAWDGVVVLGNVASSVGSAIMSISEVACSPLSVAIADVGVRSIGLLVKSIQLGLHLNEARNDDEFRRKEARAPAGLLTTSLVRQLFDGCSDVLESQKNKIISAVKKRFESRLVKPFSMGEVANNVMLVSYSVFTLVLSLDQFKAVRITSKVTENLMQATFVLMGGVSLLGVVRNAVRLSQAVTTYRGLKVSIKEFEEKDKKGDVSAADRLQNTADKAQLVLEKQKVKGAVLGVFAYALTLGASIFSLASGPVGWVVGLVVIGTVLQCLRDLYDLFIEKKLDATSEIFLIAVGQHYVNLVVDIVKWVDSSAGKCVSLVNRLIFKDDGLVASASEVREEVAALKIKSFFIKATSKGRLSKKKELALRIESFLGLATSKSGRQRRMALISGGRGRGSTVLSSRFVAATNSSLGNSLPLN